MAQVKGNADLSNDKVYTVTTARGAWWVDQTNNRMHYDENYNLSSAAPTNDVNYQFAFINYEGHYYLYAPAVKKFVQPQKYFVTGYSTPVTLAVDGENVKVKAENSNLTINIGGSQWTWDTWTAYDDGNKVAIVEAADFSAADLSEAISILTGATHFDPHKVYTIACERVGNWAVSADHNSLSSTTAYAGATDAEKQFAFYYDEDGQLYIYSVGAKKFLKADGTFANGVKGDPMDYRIVGTSGYDHMLFIPSTNCYFNSQTQGGYSINTWSSGDAGNKQDIVAVENIDVYDEMNAFFEAPYWDVTYNVYYKGEIVANAVVNTTSGVTAELPNSLKNEFCNFTLQPSTITTGVTEVKVTFDWTGPTLYDDYASVEWSNLYIDRGDGGKFYLCNTGTAPNYLVKDPTEKQRASEAYQWAFVGNPYKLKIYNKLEGSAKTLHSDETIAIADGDSYWSIKRNYNDGFMIGKTGDVNNFINQAGGGSSTKLGYWSSTTDLGNVFKVAEVPEIPVTNVYFDVYFKGEGEIVATGIVAGLEIGDEIPEIPSALQRSYVTLTHSTTGTVTKDMHIPVTATWNNDAPFKISDTYDNATWYYATLRDTKYLRADDANKDNNGRYTTTTSKENKKVYKWAFLGNPYGFNIINKGHKGEYLYAGDQPKMQALADPAADEKAQWVVAPSGAGFSVRSITGPNLYINDASGAGNLGFWNSGNGATDSGSKWLIEEAPATVDVTYNVLYGGNAVASALSEEQVIGTDAKLPSVLDLGAFATYSLDLTTIANNTTTINATLTEIHFPFEVAENYENAHWYDMSIRDTWYVTSDNLEEGTNALKTVNANALGLGEDAYQWAFVGTDPYHIQLFNKAVGDSKVYAWTSTGNESVPAFVNTDTENSYWWIRKSTASGDAYKDAFMLTIPDYGYQVNQFGGAGGSLKIWASTGTGDAGSAFNVFDVPTDYSPFVTSEIAPNFESGKYFMPKAEKFGYDPAYKTSCTFEQYKAMKLALTNIDLTDVDNFVLPEDGYYILNNKKYNNNYFGISPNDAELWGNYETATAAKQIVTLTKVGTGTYTISLMGKYTPATVEKDKAVIASKDAGTYTVVITNPGYAAFQADTKAQYSALQRSSGGDIKGGEASDEACQWSVEDATSVDIPVGDAGYATAYLPFPVTAPEGVTVYTGKINGEWLTLTELNSAIPVETAVVLKAAAGTYTFGIVAPDVLGLPQIDNDLKGTLEAIDATGKYVLAQPAGEEVGFYLANSGKIKIDKVGPGKAYLEVPAGTEVKGFFLAEEDATAIANVNVNDNQAVIYNVAGQRISKMQKGINIVNGKKVLK